ncbi:Ig-like domain-containing protein, partial [Algibacter lectus]
MKSFIPTSQKVKAFYCFIFLLFAFTQFTSAQCIAVDDCDGDGILNVDDLDDDNDGVLDTDEGVCTSNPSGNWGGTTVDVSHTYSDGVVVRLVSNTTANFVSLDNFNSAGAGFWSENLAGNPSVVGNFTFGDMITVIFEDGAGNQTQVTDPIIHFDNIGESSNNVQNSAEVTLGNGLTWSRIGGTDDFLATSTTVRDGGAGSTPGIFANGYSTQSTQNDIDGSAAGSLQINGTVSTFTLTFPMAEPTAGARDFIEIIVSTCKQLDYDNDGTPNFLDVDSDNDGCPDAIEGSANYDFNSIDENFALTAAINGTGIPGGTSQTVGTSQDETQQSDECSECYPSHPSYVDSDGDTIADFCDLDDDNDGILDTDEMQVQACNFYPTLTFSGATLESGTALSSGAIYRFSNVTTNIDALVTIVSSTPNPGITTIDDDASNIASFQPVLGENNSSVEFEFQFVTTGTSNVTQIPQFYITAIDVDGDSAQGREFVELDVTNSSVHTRETPSELAIYPTAIGTMFKSSLQTAPGIDNTATNVMFTARYSQTGKFTIKIGAEPTSGVNRLFSMNFDPCTYDIYANPTNSDLLLQVLDTDNDGTPDHLDNDSDNDGCPDALEGDAGLVYADLNTNGTINASVNDNGIPIATNVGTAGAGISGQDDVSSTNNTVQAAECDSCNSSSSLFSDNDNDGIGDVCDLDDDNDGILDIDELDCSPGFVSLGQTFTNIDTGTNGGTTSATLSNIYAYNGVDVVTATYELQGSSTWSSGVSSTNNGGISGDYINTQPNNTDFPNGDVAVYTYTFSEPVYNVEFKFGGLDNADRADFLANNGAVISPVTLTNITLPIGAFSISGQTVISSASSGNSPSNAIQVSIAGPVREISITVGKQDGVAGNVTMQFYELGYCLGKDTDADNIPDYLDKDSDNDGCPDALEGDAGLVYANLNPDGSINATVNDNGIPIATNVGTVGAGTTGQDDVSSTNSAVQAAECDSCNSSSSLFSDNDNDGIPDACDLDDDNDGILDVDEYNKNCGATSSSNIHFTDSSYNQIAANTNDGDLIAYIKDFDSDVTAVATTRLGSGSFGATSPNYTDGTIQVDMQSRNSNNDVTGTSTEIVFSELILSSEFNVRSLARNGSGTYNESQNIKFYNNGVQVQFPAVIYATSGTIGTGASYDPVTGDAIAAIIGGAAQEANFRFNIDRPIDRIVIAQASDANADNIGWRLSVLCPFYGDTDNDGIYDHLDLDSDNDGCFDALEGDAGLVYANLNSDGSINAAVNDNGIPIATNVGTAGTGTEGQDDVSSTNDAVQAAECDPCNSSSSLFSDSDLDTIGDYCDLDDDNDGILDSVEQSCGNGTEAISAAAVNASIDNVALHDGTNTPQTLTQNFTVPGCPADGDVVSYTVTAFPSRAASNNVNICADVDSFKGFTNATYGDNIGIDKLAGCDGGIRYRIEFTSGAEVLDLSSLSHGNLAADEAIIITSNVPLFGQTYKRPDFDASSDNTGTNGGPTISGSGTNSVAFDNVSGGFGGNLNVWEVNSNGEKVEWVEIDYYRSSGSTALSYESFTLNHVIPCDADCDGIPNYLDLDSDNDGCFDALEGDAGLTYSNLNSDGSINAAVNDNGIPIATNVGTVGAGTTGQDDVSSTNSAVQAAECDSCNSSSSLFSDNDNDGIGDDCDLDDDNDGILDTVECDITSYSVNFDLDNEGWIIDNNNLDGNDGNTVHSTATLTNSNCDYSSIPASPSNTDYILWTDVTAGNVYFENATDLNLDLSALTNNGTLSFNWINGVYGGTTPTSSDMIIVLNGGGKSVTYPLTGVVGSLINTGTWHAISLDLTTTNFGVDLTDVLADLDVISIKVENINNRQIGDSGTVCSDAEYMALDDLVLTSLCIDTDGDGTPNYLDLDSDADGCSDADEAYNNIDADDNDTGIYGPDIPTLANGGVDANGLVVLAGVTGNAYNTIPTTTAGGLNTFEEGMTLAIDTAPSNEIKCETETAQFDAVASAAPIGTNVPVATASTDVTYQWSVSTDGISYSNLASETGTVASGTTVSLELTNVTNAMDGNIYRVVFTNEANICFAEAEATLTVNALEDAGFSYDAGAYCVSDSDPTPTVSGTSGGTFSSIPGLIINTSTGAIDVSASTPATYTVTYSVGGTCPNSSDVSVTINALDDASFSYAAAAYCVDASDPTPTITGLSGGTFSSVAGLSINASTGEIDVSASTPATYTVTYTTAGTCPNSSDVSVTINDVPNAPIISGDGLLCNTETTTLSTTATGTIVWSSDTPGVASIDSSTGEVTAISAGTTNITYTVSDGNGCSTESSVFTITVSCIDAVINDFTATPVDGVTGGTAGDVTANDTLNGAAVDDTLINITLDNDGGLTG